MLHDQLPDVPGIDLVLALGAAVVLAARDQGLDLCIADRSSPTRLLQPTAYLLPLERLTDTVLLDHLNRRLLDALVRGDPPFAGQALPPPPNGLVLIARSGIDHAVVIEMAVGALHGLSI